MRIKSLSAAGRDIGSLCKSIADQVKMHRPSAVMWLTDHRDAKAVAHAMADSANVVVGGRSRSGLIGGGSEASESSEPRVVALTLHSEAAEFQAWHSTPEGLPDLSEEQWVSAIAATQETTPHMLMLASPPRDGAFPIENWLSRLDSSLPYANKVGGLLAGSTSLWTGTTEHDGGAAGLMLSNGLELDVLVCQGALPVGPSFAITEADGNLVRSLDGKPVGETLGPIIEQLNKEGRGGSSIMAGISVPTASKGGDRGGGGGAAPRGRPTLWPPHIVRAILGYSEAHSALVLGASPELLVAPNARLQLHVFSAENAKAEVVAAAGALAAREAQEAACAEQEVHGGLMVSCLGRGPSLYGELDVETHALSAAMGRPLELAGLFAGGEIGPVGERTFVHTYTSILAMPRERRR